MCADPITLTAITVAAVQSAVSGLSAMSAANANAKLAGMQAAEKQHVREVSKLKGEQNAALAASGVELDYGSALDVAGDTADLAREDLAQIRQNSAMEAWGYRAEQKQQKAAARTAAITTVLDVGSTLLTGASKVKKPGMGAARSYGG